tara:strand:- start:806 stop:1501 length:696 start_codon:yes stop_codon:yes gene_type:complete
VAFRGFTGYGSKKPVNQPAASQPQRPAGTTGPGSGYTPGGDSYKNYSQQDQQKMFQQAGGEKKFKENVANIEQKYKRSADIQRFLDRTNLFNQFENRGDGIVKDAQGRTILSMRSPYMTAQAPTFGQLLGDMGRGIGSIFQGIAEKGTPLMQLGKGILGGIENLFTGASQAQPIPNVGSGSNDTLASFKQGLSNPQLAIFNYHYNSGNSPEYARQMALMGVPMAQGGVASL